MFFLDLVTFSARALTGHGLRTGLSLVGMSIGVASVVLLTALGEGARRYVTDQFASIGSNLIVVIPGRNETTGVFPGVTGVPNDLTLEDAQALVRFIPEVRRMAPVSSGTETVAHAERKREVAILGTTEDMLGVQDFQVGQGTFLPPGDLFSGGPVAVLGSKVVDELFPTGEAVGQRVRVGEWRLRVIGVLAPRGMQLGFDMDDVVLVPVATAMRMFNRNSLFRILLQVRAHADLGETSAKVLRLLAERHGEEDVTCFTQDAVVRTLSAILTALTLALGAIAAISLSVAGLGIMNVMLVSVSERTGEVGLLKALGVERRQVLAVFLTEAAFLSSAGGGLGVLVGWLLVRALVLLFPAFPASPPWWAILAALGVAFFAGIVFGLLPARRAMGLDPVAALARR